MTPLRIAFLLALALSALFALWRPSDGGGVMSGVEGRLLDARFLLRGPLPAPTSVAILAIDDASLTALNAFPPPRDALATGLRAAHAAGARSVAFDLLLVGQGQGDAALEQVLTENPQSVLAISLLGEDPAGVDRDLNGDLQADLARSALPLVIGAPQGRPRTMLAPLARLGTQAWLAHVNVQPEADGALRRIPLFVQAGPGLILPVLPLQALRVAGETDVVAHWGQSLRLGDRTTVLTANNEAAINFYGPEGTIPTFSMVEAAQADLAGRVVFIGASALGYGDRFATPFARDMPGVEVLASLAANLIEGRSLRRDDLTWGLDVLIALFVAGLGVVCASRRVPALAVITTLALWGGALGGLQFAFVQGFWLDGATLLATLLTATLCGGAARLMLQRRAAMNLAQYQSPLLKEVLAASAQPAFDGSEQAAAILFVDVAHFTNRSAALGHAATAVFLRRFHNIVERAATAHSGLVEQYAGDGAMICFGLPKPLPRDAANALRCAEALFASVADMNTDLGSEGQPPVDIRVTAHFGQVTAAVLGGARQGHVTFVGDVVNVTSRLQEVAKTLGADLVVSDDLVTAAGTVADFDLRPVGPVKLRGRDAAISLWVRSIPDPSIEQGET
ncbi:CHASE2 domain-containing protein [Antarctobacter heliothermus]|uniref:Adenylate cyclase n=1 Tax=Antarctobacter heliothermus TaxID=74033 RepID=A0A239FW98_9RHOB|nr:adenylate/guanylate cyclase domain-containing protein [Antarctobacter heliothermus]SNS61151.1 adenylate cyclase [Antarctobacter heliothermus]